MDPLALAEEAAPATCCDIERLGRPQKNYIICRKLVFFMSASLNAHFFIGITQINNKIMH